MRKIALIPLLLVVAACSGKVSIGSNGSTSGNLKKNPDGGATGNGQTCNYDGRDAAVGDVFTSSDGCNTCTCAADGAYCTEMACAPDGGADAGVCAYNGKVYNPGDSFPSSDGCNSCGCSEDGRVPCTKKACVTDCSGPKACSGPAPGAPTILCADGTTAGPKCADIGGTCGWTFTECSCQGAPGHKAGDTWQQDCSTCDCDSAGMVACTASACACPADGTINCMPPVQPSQSGVCSGSYHQWVVANCPNVKFVF